MTTPFLRNRDPDIDVGGVLTTKSCSFDVLTENIGGIDPLSLLFYVGSDLAYRGSIDLWYSPFDGYVGKTIVDGYDGYHVRIDHSVEFQHSDRINLRVIAEDAGGGALDETYGFWVLPALISMTIEPYETTLKLIFSGDMDSSSLLDSSLFTISNGAYVRKVDVQEPNIIKLWVEKLYGSYPFSLTISTLVKDTHDGYLERTSTDVDIFQSSAFFSNTNGFIRSWHNSDFIRKDEKRAYLCGASGIDVFNTTYGLNNSYRWAQILDSYGISAVCLVNTNDGYEFSESTSPWISNCMPIRGSTVPIPTTISFTINDRLSLEIVSVAIYISNTLVFSGVSGWNNNWGGQITVYSNRIDVELFPPQDFFQINTVIVRIVAYNLMEILLDDSYLFYITP